MKTEYVKINLSDLVEKYGESRVKAILADFSCPLNNDVQEFLKNKAIEFSKQSIAQTQLIYYIKRDDEDKVIEKYLVGYFSLAQKIINVEKKALSNKLARRISRYSYYDAEKKSYSLPVILIGQLGKNYNDNSNKLISGKDLLNLAISSITLVQRVIGGKVIFLECEDKPELLKFYEENDFFKFGKRKLDRDETNIEGEYLIQWICYPAK